MKQSEARILIYLSVVPAIKKNLTTISNKLQMDYGFTIRVLSQMEAKGWIFKHRHGRFMAYDLTPSAPIEQAKEWYKDKDLQKTLESEEE